MQFQDNQSLAEFLTAAQRSPALRDRLLAAIDKDPELRGAALLHAANDDRASEELIPAVNRFVAAMESGDPEKQGEAIDGLNAKLFRELGKQGFTDEWISSQMALED